MLVLYIIHILSTEWSDKGNPAARTQVLPEDASIPLTDLPGIVVRKWLDKKKRMQMLVDKTLGAVRWTTIPGRLVDQDSIADPVYFRVS